MIIRQLLTILSLIQLHLSFVFKQLTVSPTLYNVGVTTQYYFYYQRSVSSTSGQSLWNVELVPGGSTITVTFPPEYTIASPTCVSVLISSVAATGYNCTSSSNTITISGAIPNSVYIDIVEVTVGNIVNPVPAVPTSPFQGTIGTDTSLPDNGIQLTAAAFDNCTIIFDAAYVNQTSTMVVILDPKNALDSTSSILVDVPAHWTNDIVTSSRLPVTSTMNCVNYSSGVTSAPTCSGNNILYTITATNVLLTRTTTSFSFGIKQLTSPPTLQPSDSIVITSYSGIYQVDTCTIFPTSLLPNVMVVTMNSIETMTVNTQVGFQVFMTLADWANNNDDIQIIFPTEITPTFVNVTGTGIYTTSACFVTGQTMTITHRRIDRIYNKASVYTLNVYKIKAPPSTKTTNQITVKIVKNGFDKMVGYTTIRAVASTLTGVVAATLTTVNKVTSYKINITTTDPLTSSGMIKIVFPSTITPTLLSGCATLSGTSVRTNPTCVYDPASYTMTLTNLNSSSSSIPAQTFRFTILSVQNGPSIGPSASFSAMTYYTTDVNDLVSQGTIAGVTATLDIIDPSKVTVVPSTYVVSDTLITYTLTFTSGNNIPQSGYAEITIPSAVTLAIGSLSSYCKLSINSGAFFATSCAGTATGTGYYVNFSSIAQSSALPAATNISLRIQSLFTNPGDTSIVSTFTIKTYHSDGYAIEQLTTGITVQMTTPSTMTSMAVTRTSQLNSNPSVTYTFRLKQTPAMPANCRLTIGFPTSLVISGNLTIASLTGVSLGFLVATASVEVQLVAGVSSGAEFGVVITGIGNPPSFATLGSPFTFSTKSSDRILSYASGSLTSSLQTSIPSTFSTLSGTYSTLIYGQPTNLQLTLTPSPRLTPSYILVTIPSSFTVPSSLSCTSWSCVSISSNTLRINNITSTTQMSFTIAGVTAPIAATNDSVLVESYDSGGFKIDMSSGAVLFAVTCALPCRTCSTTNTSSCLSCYTNTAISTSTYYYSTLTTCYSTCPTSTYADTSSGLRCLDCNSLCKTCVVTSTNCTSCVVNSTYQYLYVVNSTGTCRSLCPIYYYADTTVSPAQCLGCVSPCLTCTSATQCTSCRSGFYFYNNSCGTSCPTGITIPNNSSNNCDLCSAQCATCSGTVDTCIGCSADSAVYNSTCVTTCPSPYVKRNGICSSCSTSCLTCSINYDNCTSCQTVNSTLPYLYGNTCVGVCPELYYASLADGMCKLCSTLNIGCNNCTSTATCGTCNWDQGFVYLNSRCYAAVPTGYYNSSGYALACNATADCATCVNFAYNCTACISLNLQGNTCVSQCSAGFVGINKQCTACTSNCRTCSNLQSNCTSCITTSSPSYYLSNYQCNTTCPDYTYPNVTNHQCTPCSTPCQKCTSLSQCVTCQLGYFLENNSTSCVANCSFGYLGVNRVCVRCTSNCDGCVLGLSVCTSCLSGFYLVVSTSTCVNPCPTGLYPNSATGTCTGCVTPCNTCSLSATNCTSCQNNLTFFNYSCVSNCSDGYYQLNNQCNPCNSNCSTCTSATVCVTCVFGLYLYAGSCVGVCPATHPVMVTGVCAGCSDGNCIVCDGLDQCSSCNYPTLLLSGHCLTSCPTNYTSNTTHCIYNPPNNTTPTNTTTDTSTSNTTLNTTLSTSNIFPVPFTIGATFIGIACIMSKFQHSYTFVSGALYAMWAVLEWGALGVGAYLYWVRNGGNGGIGEVLGGNVEVFVFVAAVGGMYLLNVLGLFAQNCYLRGDVAFKRWLDKQGPNSCFYTFTSILSLLLTHKFKSILFTNLFGFQIFKAKLTTVQSFKIFNILSFLSFIPSGAILFSTSYMIYKYHVADQELMAYIDILVLTLAVAVLAVVSSRKGDDFFQERGDDGVVVNRRIVESDSIMQEAITPFMAEEHQDRGNFVKNNTYETQRKFKSYTQSLSSEQPSYHYIQPSKDMQDISIQAAPVLHDYSKIDFYNDEQMSDISMFKKVDRSVNVSQKVQKVDQSINMTRQFQANQVSVQNDMNVFQQEDVSVQNNPMQDDVSVQHQVDVRDVSLQNVVNHDEQAVQMSRHEDDHSVQVGVLANNASVQYSAKPVFENLSQDFIDSDGQENNFNNGTQLEPQQSREQRPAQTPKGLKAELELDVDEKLRQKQEQIELEREQEIARKKQEMLQKFHQEQDKKAKLSQQNQQPLQRKDNFDNVNKMYNNDNSRLDGSSLMDSDANIMVHFRKNTKKQIHQNSKQIQPHPQPQPQRQTQAQRQQNQRVQSAKTQKQLIDMIQNNQPGLDVESSMSFNVTRDLEDVRSSKNKKVKNVVYEEQDKSVDSGGDQVMVEESPERNRRREVYILENDAQEEIPSIEKSRSTNFLSTNGRRPPLPHRTQSKNLLDESSRMQNSIPDNDYEQIINHPIKAVAKHVLPNPHYRQQQLQYVNRTNLNQFLQRRKNNPVSAHQFSSNNKITYSESQQIFSNNNKEKEKERELKQNPLPLPKIERLKSQESNHSNDNNQRLYRLNSRKALVEDRKLEFDEEEKIYNLNSEQDQYESRLPRVINADSRLKNVKSLNKFPERDTSYQKPVHREILGRDRFVDRTQKFLERQSRKAQNTKKKIQQMQVMLQRPNINSNKGYLKETHSSIDKKKKSQLEKVYMNNPFEKKF